MVDGLTRYACMPTMEGWLDVHGCVCMICGDNWMDQIYMERLAGLFMMYGMIGLCMTSI